MRHSLEARTPFLDYRLAEFAATLPVKFKVNTDAIREKFICGRTYAKFDILDQGDRVSPETAVYNSHGGLVVSAEDPS